MSYSHAVFGEIRIHPPLNRAQALDPRWRDLRDVAFVLTETHELTDESRVIKTTSDELAPKEEGSGGYVAEELQLIVDIYGKDHTFYGYFHVNFEAGLCGPDESPCERIFIRDRLVVTVEPEITWPEGAH